MVNITESETVVFSQIESERFGVRVARAHVVPDNLLQVLHFWVAEKIDLLIARCATNDLVATKNMEMQAFNLMDTLLYYRFDLAKRAIPEDTGEFLVRRLQPGDEEQVRTTASAAFKGYMGHYHADRRLDR